MSVDIATLKQYGCSSGHYKPIWTKQPSAYSKRQKRLVDLISGRIRDGYTNTLREHRAYYAVDLAFETPFAQTTATFVNHIRSQNLNYDQTVEALKSYGLSESELFLDIPAADGSMRRMINVPVFYQIYIPIVKAYVTAITAEIFNERNTVPMLPYKPLKNSEKNKIRCDVITDIGQTMATQYGYASLYRQTILQMLKYGIMLAFPREEWHTEYQIIDGKKELVKEGLRYMTPHPSRTYFDLEYPLTSFNTDTGCTFAGHWHVLSYGTILDNRDYWNRANIFSGTNWFQSPLAGNYFSEVFPCNMKWPPRWTGPMNREDKMAWYNSSEDRDKAVFVTEHFQKLVPKDWDLGTYPYPVWHRFTVAGDDTIIWSEPVGYNPVWFMGYDYDEQMARTSSLGLEIIPWQDQLGNILSQMLLTMRQNLTNVIFYDTNLVDGEEIKIIQNSGERKYKSIQWVPFDSFKNAAARLNQTQAFFPVKFEKVPIAEQIQCLSTTLNIMERVLQISPQQLGGAASHQQSKAEVVQTAGSGNNRIAFLSTTVDEGTDAWMRQLYDAEQNYLDPKFEAEITNDTPDIEKHLADMGFTIRHKGENTVTVSGHKRRLRLEGFASVNVGPNRTRDKEIAQVIFQVVSTVAGQEDLHKKIGAKNLLRLIEQAAILSGAPADFKLNIDQDAEDDQQVEPQVLEAIKQAQSATMDAIQKKIVEPIAQEIGQDQTKIEQMQQTLAQLQKIYEIAAQTQDKNAIKARESAAKQQQRAQEAAAEEQRKQQAFLAEQQRKTAALLHKLAAANAELQQKLNAMQAESRGKIEAGRVKAEADAAAKRETATAEK